MIVDTRDPIKKDARRSRRRAVILPVAAQSFMEKGYSATSMTAIAREIGGSKTTLWSCFPSKEQLFFAVFENGFSACQEQIRASLDGSVDLNAALRAFCRAFIARIASPDFVGFYRLVVAESDRFPEIGKMFHERAIWPIHASIADFLGRHISKGALRETDPSRAAQALTTLCMGKQLEMLVGESAPTPTQIDVEAAFVADVFLRAFEANRRASNK